MEAGEEAVRHVPWDSSIAFAFVIQQILSRGSSISYPIKPNE